MLRLIVAEFGPRFPPMNHAYCKEFRTIAHKTARELNITNLVREGVYACVSGPSFETPAEAIMLLRGGADVVGMSTAPEVVVAQHCGIKCLGISLVTNNVVMDVDSADAPNHEEVLETGLVSTDPATCRLQGHKAHRLCCRCLKIVLSKGPKLV